MKRAARPNIKKSIPTVLALVAIGGIGSLLLNLSHAGTSSVATESETGTVTAPAQATTDITASGSQAVRFGAVSGVSGSTPGPLAGDAPTDWAAGDCVNRNGLTAHLVSVTTVDPDHGPTARVTVGRCYLVYIPTTLGTKSAGNKIPILLNLHGGGGNAQGHATRTQMNTQADESKFIVIYPYGGAGTPNSGSYGWSNGVGRTPLVGLPQDYDFLYSIINDIAHNPAIVNGYTVNTKRAYLVGFSSGGLLAQNVACASDSPFAAVATVSAVLTKTPLALPVPASNVDSNGVNFSVRCTPSRPTPVLDIHNKQDTTVAWNGNPTGTPAWNSLQDSFETDWHTMNGCTGNTITDVTSTYNAPVTLTEYDQTGCANGATTRLMAITTSTSGSQHAFWDNTAPNPFYYTTIDDIIWNFLAPHSLP